jgi:hypothetical protein
VSVAISNKLAKSNRSREPSSRTIKANGQEQTPNLKVRSVG